MLSTNEWRKNDYKVSKHEKVVRKKFNKELILALLSIIFIFSAVDLEPLSSCVNMSCLDTWIIIDVYFDLLFGHLAFSLNLIYFAFLKTILSYREK